MSITTHPALRPDLALIVDWIRPGARVLDLGCGEGALLAYLTRHRQVQGYGLDIDEPNITACINAGVNVIEADIDDGLRDFRTNSFDVVMMTQALQALVRPDLTIAEMLRVGRQAIITFPNFGHWRVRGSLFGGRMPVTPSLPAPWFATPNIHLCTVEDFEALCRDRGWQVRARRLLDRSHREGARIRMAPNLFAEHALYLLEAPASGGTP
ncbi:methionine biosynthesis protein MetW [Flagellatimonas centrodinii]|uniref:methionine biosynthesis protein MetW n=1 Tax=Flagellatimonas centrodinii TaxID=2806210 RepID=UPI001FFB4C5A|nr:methionine biosynthesis protein MetW [Flagellatimonas centrodinii]ULQ45511.1 methionine biosynthesis protein MetW [Flagellatimonas centrodinii]